jgi:hypothetical protein
LLLIELMTAAIQAPHDSLRQSAAVALKMLEGNRIVAAVVEIDRRDIMKPRLEIGR